MSEQQPNADPRSAPRGGADEATAPAPPDPRPLLPALRAHEGAAGLPIMLADGQNWLLAFGGLATDLNAHRDEFYDRWVLRGLFEPVEIAQVAMALLRANYDLSPAEAASLVWPILRAQPDGSGEPPPGQALLDKCLECLFGNTENPSRPWTYNQWVWCSLLANSVDPYTIPPDLLEGVLYTLVRRGDALPREQFISSAEAAAKRAARWQLPPKPAQAVAPSQAAPAARPAGLNPRTERPSVEQLLAGAKAGIPDGPRGTFHHSPSFGRSAPTIAQELRARAAELGIARQDPPPQ